MRIARDFEQEYYFGRGETVLRDHVFAVFGVWAGHWRGGVSAGDEADDRGLGGLYVHDQPSGGRAVVSTDPELVVGVFDGADV